MLFRTEQRRVALATNAAPFTLNGDRHATDNTGIGACLLLLLSHSAAWAQPDRALPAVGGGGGNDFVARCPVGEHLVGFNLRAGHNIDAIQPVCGVPESEVRVNVRTEMPMYGGNGGSPAQVMCPNQSTAVKSAPVVVGLFLRAEGINGYVMNDISLYCGIVANQQPMPTQPAAHYEAPMQEHTYGALASGHMVKYRRDTLMCPPGSIGVGVYGRSGAALDSMGLICGAPQTGFKTTRTLGKRKRPSGGEIAAAGNRYIPGARSTLGERKLPTVEAGPGYGKLSSARPTLGKRKLASLRPTLGKRKLPRPAGAAPQAGAAGAAPPRPDVVELAGIYDVSLTIEPGVCLTQKFGGQTRGNIRTEAGPNGLIIHLEELSQMFAAPIAVDVRGQTLSYAGPTSIRVGPTTTPVSSRLAGQLTPDRASFQASIALSTFACSIRGSLAGARTSGSEAALQLR